MRTLKRKKCLGQSHRLRSLPSVRLGGLVLLAISAVCVLFAAPMLQQTAVSGDLDIATVLPTGAMIYLESKEFSGQLRDWSESSVKQHWLEGENFSQFEKSRLYLRLKDKLQEFSGLAGVSVDLPLLRSLAGNQAGLGLYNIRDIEFVFATRISGSQFEQGPFFQQRPQYEQRTAEGGTYFARNGQGGAIAFAIRRNYFFLATSETLLRSALHNVAVASSREGLSAEPLFQESQAALARSADLWMFLNMSLIQSSRSFRNEWLYQNFEETSRYRAGVVRLSRLPNQYREERQFLLKDDASLPEKIDPVLLQSIPRSMEFVRAEAASSRDIAAMLYSALLNPLRRRDETLSLTGSDAPYEIAPLLKTGNRYFLQIDEPMPAAENIEESRRRVQEQLISQLEREIEALGVKGFQQCVAPQLDSQGYCRVQQALLLNGGGKSLSSLKQVLQNQYNRLYLSGTAATWARGEGTLESLGTLAGLTLGSKGSLLVIGNSESLAQSLLSSESTVPLMSERPLYSYARLDAKRFRSNYKALFQWLDHQAHPRNPGEPPPYFSQNLGSLVTALSPLQAVTVQSWAIERILHQEVVYDLQ